MTITLNIPDDLTPQFIRPGRILPVRCWRDAAVEAYRMHRLTTPQLRRLLGIASRHELDGMFGL